MCLPFCRTFRASLDQQPAPTDGGTRNRKCYELWERVLWRTVSGRVQSRRGNVFRGGIEWPRNGFIRHLKFAGQEPPTSITQLRISPGFHVTPAGLVFKWAVLLLTNKAIYSMFVIVSLKIIQRMLFCWVFYQCCNTSSSSLFYRLNRVKCVCIGISNIKNTQQFILFRSIHSNDVLTQSSLYCVWMRWGKNQKKHMHNIAYIFTDVWL